MIKRIFAFLLAMVLLAGAFPVASVHAHEADDEGIELLQTEETEPVTEETEPATEDTEPVTEETEPVTEETEPVTEETEPTTEETEPTTEETEPVTEETEPTTEETEPVTEETEPATEETEPVTEETEPVTEETEPTTEETEPVTEENAPSNLSITLDYKELGLPSDEELFAGYVEQKFYGEETATFGITAGSRLKGNNKVLYDAWCTMFKQIADGTCTDTTISVGKTVTDDNGKTWVPDIRATFSGYDLDINAVYQAILIDLPYAQYWHNKTLKVECVHYDYADGNYTFFAYRFPVTAEYRGSNLYTTDSNKTGAASKAVRNAQSVVNNNAAKSDYDKLLGYKNWICSQVAYNTPATKVEGYYGDPWQLIWAFDGNTTTDIVCEGYSKAFKYLCDMSTFSSDVGCYLVTGYLDNDPKRGHMWNHVTLNGQNYMVDVTNSDTNMAGQNGGLFMTGGPGSVYTGYTFVNTLFAYSDAIKKAWGTDSNSILKLSNSFCKNHSFGSWYTTKLPGCTTTGQKSRTCSCGLKDTATLAPTGHSYIYSVTAPTCAEKGYTTYVCSTCNDSYKTAETAALGHIYNNGRCDRCGLPQCTTHHYAYAYTQTAATCTAGGVDIHKCSVCATENQVATSALGHTGGTATCVSPKICTRCQTGYGSKNSKNHSYSKKTVAPTAAKKGYTLHTCTLCGNSYKTNIKKAKGLSAPKVLKRVLAQTGNPYLKWKQVSDSTKYYVYRATSKNGSYKKVATRTTKGSDGYYTYEDKNATLGKVYYYKVKAVGEDVTSKYSAAQGIYRICAQPTVTDWVIVSSTGNLKLTWKKVSGAKKYDIYRATSENGTYKRIATTKNLNYTISSGDIGKTYYYKVRAIASNSNYNSTLEYSNYYYGARACAQVKLSVKIDSTSGFPLLSWNSVKGASRYYIYRSESADGANGQWLWYLTNKYTSCIDNTASFNKTYYYSVYVMGTKEGTDSGLCPAKKLFVRCATPVVTIKLSSNKPTLSWEKVPVAAGYEIYRATSKNGTYTCIATTADTSYRDSSAKKGKTYYYKVKAISSVAGTDSVNSAIKSIKSK